MFKFLLLSADTFALSIRPATKEIAIATSTASMPITTRSSIKVKPLLCDFVLI